MVRILVVYSSNHGHTRKIARTITDKLADNGSTVELSALGDALDIELNRFDGVILAASIHVSSYQSALSDFLIAHQAEINRKKTLFLSISLSAAGHDAEEWRSLRNIVSDLEIATGWKPTRLEQIAGAYKPSEYDFFRRFVMRRIIAAKDSEADLDRDKEYTDWKKLDQVVEEWLGELDHQS